MFELDVSTPMPWLDYMKTHIGEHEFYGPDNNNPFILALFTHTSYKALTDETPWCAAAACTALEETGFQSPHRADAISFKEYGTPCELTPGCIVVLEREDGGHHVTFCNNVIDPYLFAGLGGNQSDMIKYSAFRRDKIIATRWPIKKLNATTVAEKRTQ